MSDFSPTDAAFEGFRIIRHKPSAVMGWVLFGVLWILLVIGGLVLFMLPHLAELRQALRPLGGGRDWEGLGAIFLPATLFAFLFSFAVYATLKSAIYRAVLHPDWKGLSHLSLGRHEIYVFLSELASMALLIVYYGVIFAVTVALTASLPPVLSFLIRVPVGLAAFAVWIWWGARLGLAKVASYAEDRVSVFDTWAMTRGRFWPLLATFILSWVLGAIVFACGLFVAVKIVQAVGLTYAASAGAISVSEAAVGLGKALVALLLNTMALVVSYTITIAPTARAYEMIKAAGAAPSAPAEAEPAAV
jgi:hypothetical protein